MSKYIIPPNTPVHRTALVPYSKTETLRTRKSVTYSDDDIYAKNGTYVKFKLPKEALPWNYFVVQWDAIEVTDA